MAGIVHDRRVQSRLHVGSSLALGVGLLLSTSLLTGGFYSFQNRLADLLYRPEPTSGQIVLVQIDDASLKEIGPWPWSRTTFANLVDNIAAAGPRALALDVLFPDPAADDPLLARALERIPRVVQPILGVDATRLTPGTGSIPRYRVALISSTELRTKNSEFAHALITVDADGIVRRIPAAIEVSGETYYGLGILAITATGQEPRLENGFLVVGQSRLPIDAQGQVYLSYSNPATRQVVSAAAVMRAGVDPRLLAGKIVLVGLADSTLADHYRTPITVRQESASSIDIQANLMETALDNRGLVEQDRLNQITMIFLMALLAGATLPHFRLLSAFGLTLLYFLAYLVYAFEKYSSGILVQPLYPALALGLTFASTMTVRYFSEERQRLSIARLFRRSVAPENVEQVLSNFEHGTLVLGGTRRTVTLLWVDLAELADLVEGATAHDLVDVLNKYLQRIIGAVFRNEGSVALQSGDAVLAVWNLPLDQLDHAHRAVLTAMEIRQDLAKLDIRIPKELAIRVGMGVATGTAVAGNVGSSARAEYAVIGHVVAVAERLAMNNDRSILLDSETRQLIGDEIDSQEAKPMRLRGQTEPIPVWTVLERMELEPEPEPESTTADA